MTRCDTLRFDFSSEVLQEREQVYARIMDLLAEQTYDAAKEANRLHMDWLRKYPDDAIALDAGEIVAMTISSYEAEALEASPEQAVQKPIASLPPR